MLGSVRRLFQNIDKTARSDEHGRDLLNNNNKKKQSNDKKATNKF